MSRAAAPRVRALSIHADYRCRGAGACCSSGWAIPVEPGVEDGIRAALRAGVLRHPARRPSTAPGREDGALRPVSGLPHGARVVLETDAGRCVFFERGGLCAVHRTLGEGALPSACRHFPRVVTLTPLGVAVTLSHYCPTAASSLFREDVALAVVEDPPAFPPSRPWEGLDARDALPPLLRPGVLMDWPSLERWERLAVSVLARDARSPEDALDALAGTAEDVRRWTPERGPFGAFFEEVLSGRPWESARSDPSMLVSTQSLGVAWHLVAKCVPHGALLPAAPERPDDADARWVAPAWPALSRPIRRWLAAKAFASWLLLQGEGLRTTVLGLRTALFVLRAEAARGCAEAGRSLDASLLKEAVRRADLLLVHLADPDALARRLSLAESAKDPTGAW
ncbi:MAG TPA: hypothetical protein VMT70_07905 [Vicinamibacteria bacterium]|nr:hypothetical protein [Vicinamibacteria bacterium]